MQDKGAAGRWFYDGPSVGETDHVGVAAWKSLLHGSRVVLDASGPALRAALPHGPYLIKPSLNELRQLTGRALETEADCMETAQEIVRNGHAHAVALTLGAGGAMLVTQEEIVRAGAVATSFLSTIGAGDSFDAGFLRAYLLTKDTVTCARVGNITGALSTQASGGTEAFLDQNLRDNFLRKHQFFDLLA